MTVNPSQTDAAPSSAQPSDKELNFRKLEESFNRKIEQERQARQQAEERLAQLEKTSVGQRRQVDQDDDDDADEPYVDHKRLRKEIGKVKQSFNETEGRIQQAVQQALADERKNQWMKSNPDFYDIMQHAQKFADSDPELAETILAMPEGFERQKLVYKNIKALGLHKPPEEAKPSIQDKINQNKRNHYYVPTGSQAPPFENNADFSSQGKETAYKRMKELQKRIGIFS